MDKSQVLHSSWDWFSQVFLILGVGCNFRRQRARWLNHRDAGLGKPFIYAPSLSVTVVWFIAAYVAYGMGF